MLFMSKQRGHTQKRIRYSVPSPAFKSAMGRATLSDDQSASRSSTNMAGRGSQFAALISKGSAFFVGAR
jgi:hypothetical protein